jgi:uncharacterized tellurite resistance protein B-like protein
VAARAAKADSEEEQVSITEINLDDSAELTPENMQALLNRAKRAGKQAAKKTRMACDTAQALANSGLLRTTRRLRKKRDTKNGSE